MNYLELENVSKSYGEKILFDQVSLKIYQGQKVALVAKNGSGKSTLLRVIAGEESAEGEQAKVWRYGGIGFYFLQQDQQYAPESTIFDIIFTTSNPVLIAIRAYREAMLLSSKKKELEKAILLMDDLKAWDAEARVEELLSKFEIWEWDKTVGQLSGGQKKRLSIVKMILEEPDFLILDEPTNHLDIDMIEWLEEYLQQKKLTLFMVTHDRYFLERVCDQIVELDRGHLYTYSGNYSDYLEKKANRLQNERVEQAKDQKLLKKELAWIRRMPKARTTKSKSRIDQFEELKDKVSKSTYDKELKLQIKGRRLGKTILEMHYVNKAFGDLCIVKEFNYKFKKFERVGIVGPNGVGKTTFLKLLTGEIPIDSGQIITGVNTVIGYYTQSGIQFQEDKRVIDFITDIAEYIVLDNGQKVTAPTLLERFLFSRKQQQVYISQLSGGEKRRLYLLSVLMGNPNFLILDEPTNDLDIITLNVLEEFLIDFPGCVIVVTHDRYFMDKIVDHLFLFEGHGMIKDFNGDYSDYRKRVKNLQTQQKESAKSQQIKQQSKTAKNDDGLTKVEKNRLKKLEKELAVQEEKKKEIQFQFDTPDLTPDEIKELSMQLKLIDTRIEEIEMEWMEIVE